MITSEEKMQSVVATLMAQAQVFASAWSIVGGPFDDGSALVDAEEAKAELKSMIEAALQESEAVAVYQRQFIPGNWKDVTEEEFNLLPDFYPRRIVYLAPQSAQAIETAAIMKCVGVCRNDDTGQYSGDRWADELLALIPQDGRTQLEQKCMEVANAAFDFGYYDCESPAVDCVEPKLRAIVTNLIGETK